MGVDTAIFAMDGMAETAEREAMDADREEVRRDAIRKCHRWASYCRGVWAETPLRHCGRGGWRRLEDGDGEPSTSNGLCSKTIVRPLAAGLALLLLLGALVWWLTAGWGSVSASAEPSGGAVLEWDVHLNTGYEHSQHSLQPVSCASSRNLT